MKSYLKYLFFTTFILMLIGCGGGTTTTDELNDSGQQNENPEAAFTSGSVETSSILSPVAPKFVQVSDSVDGTAILSWQTPTTNTDGSELTSLAGYYIYFGKVDDYGKVDGIVNNVVDIQNATATTHTFLNIKTSEYFFAISAYSQTGAESQKVAPVVGTNN